MKNKMNIRIALRTCLLAGLVLSLLQPAGAQMLLIKGEVTTQGSSVRLADLLQETSGVPTNWLDRTVLNAPDGNTPDVIPLTSVAYALQQYPDMKTASVSGSMRVVISRAQRRVMPIELSRAVEEFVAMNTGNTGTYQLEFAPIRRNIWIPHGETTYNVAPSRSARNQRQYDTYLVSIDVDGEPVCNVPVRAKKYELHQVWVAARPLDCGSLLQPGDLRQELLPLEHKGHRRIDISEPIVGQEIDRSIETGDPILRNYLRTPLCARKGDYITVVAQTGTLQISLRAKALSTGRLGERILCMNERSRRQLLVQLTGIQKARLAKL